jgi:hypothetical protein
MAEREMHKVNLFIEPDLWRLVKIRAAERDLTATMVLNEILREYFKGAASQRASRQPQKGGRRQ